MMLGRSLYACEQKACNERPGKSSQAYCEDVTREILTEDHYKALEVTRSRAGLQINGVKISVCRK